MRTQKTTQEMASPMTSNDNVLPREPERAMQHMITLSQKLINIAEAETQNLVQNDIVGFAILQDEKEKVTNSYARASREFRDRLNEFRGVERSMLDRLDALQKDLAIRTQSNNVIVKRIQNRAGDNAQKTLWNVQELAQQKVVQFPEQKLAQNSHDDTQL